MEEREMMERGEICALMATLCAATQNIRAAEGYLLELLAWCAFGERDEEKVIWN